MNPPWGLVLGEVHVSYRECETKSLLYSFFRSTSEDSPFGKWKEKKQKRGERNGQQFCLWFAAAAFIAEFFFFCGREN